MTKTFCDKCGRESKKFTDLTFKVVHTEFTLRESGSDQEESDICTHCVIDSIAALDDRPTQVTGTAAIDNA